MASDRASVARRLRVRRRLAPRTVAVGARWLLAAALLVVASAAPAQERPDGPRAGGDPKPTWQQVKCARYAEATAEAVRRLGRDGIGEDFWGRHEAFIAAGCGGPPDVCPRSAKELALADTLIAFGMNGGLSGTFMPFACRR